MSNFAAGMNSIPSFLWAILVAFGLIVLISDAVRGR